MAGAGAARPLVLPLPEVDAVTKGWTKRNNPWLLRAAAATKSTGRYRHNAAMLYLGRIRVYEMGPLDRDRFTADRTATISVLGQPEKVASIHTQGRGDSKRIVARLESCGVDMQIRFYADAVSGSASYSVMGGAKYPISCVRMILFNQRVRSSLFLCDTAFLPSPGLRPPCTTQSSRCALSTKRSTRCTLPLLSLRVPSGDRSLPYMRLSCLSSGEEKGSRLTSEMVIPFCLLSLIACFARSTTGFQVCTPPRFC